MACQFITSYFPLQPNKKLLELSFNQPFPRNEIAQSRNSLKKLRPETKDLCVLNWHRLLRNACFLAEANVLRLQTRTKPLLPDLPGTPVGFCSGQVAQSNCFQKKARHFIGVKFSLCTQPPHRRPPILCKCFLKDCFPIHRTSGKSNWRSYFLSYHTTHCIVKSGTFTLVTWRYLSCATKMPQGGLGPRMLGFCSHWTQNPAVCSHVWEE